uniref:Uncharacterized protein n=1 Tax=Arundo donax TaxID=35708 RepID=A0A0A9CEP3_ARUDO
MFNNVLDGKNYASINNVPDAETIFVCKIEL